MYGKITLCMFVCVSVFVYMYLGLTIKKMFWENSKNVSTYVLISKLLNWISSDGL